MIAASSPPCSPGSHGRCSTHDRPEAAAARGVPVGTLGAAFLVLLGIDAGEATQAVGALLLLGLVAAPAAPRCA